MKQKQTISKWGFILSVLGAAVGLGGIWGFPTKLNEYGGTFLIPFLIALVISALPLLLIEMNLGNTYRKNHVLVFEQLADKPGRFFGFLQSAVVWLMSIFYSVLVAWSLLALIMGFLPGLTTENYFLGHLIGQTNGNPKNFNQLGSISLWPLGALIAVWILTGLILLGGVTKGIDFANKIFIPTLFVIMLLMMIFTLTLSGAGDGLKTIFSFNGSALLKGSIWSDAFGQAFFMLSTCTGAIIIFASHAPPNQNNTNQALIISIGTVVVALITSITIFATIGAIAKSLNQPFNKVFQPGPTLIFQVFPQIFSIISDVTGSLLLSHFLAILFFLSVFFAGISSLIAMVEAVVNPIVSELKIKRYKALLIILVLSLLIDILFIFNNSSKLIDGLALWVAGVWQMIIGIIELIGITYLWKCYDELATVNNRNSWFKWDKRYFYWLCLIIVPIIIALNLGLAIFQWVNLVSDNTFVFLAIGAVLGAVGPLIFTSILHFYPQIKKLFISKKISNPELKPKIIDEEIEIIN